MDLTTLLSKFLTSLYAGAINSAVDPLVIQVAGVTKLSVSASAVTVADGVTLGWGDAAFSRSSANVVSLGASLLFGGAYNIGDGAGNSPVNIYAEGLIASSSPTAGIGYGTGAGGTVTQATNKGTAVTLNTITGEITMNAAALAAATVVEFSFTNSAIATGDLLILSQQSAASLGSYTLYGRTGGGGAVIAVRNNTAGSLSDAIVIKFVIIKAVTS